MANNRSTDSIKINYAGYKDGFIRKTSVKEIVISNPEIVIFGEGNFTFSVALAALRGRWNGITTTKKEVVVKPDLWDVILECIEYCISNGRDLKDADSTIVSNVKKIVDVKSFDQTWHYQHGVDATTTDMIVQNKVVWFQCPWIPQEDEGRTDTLVKRFIDHMGDLQATGDYLLIGITKCFPYVCNYDLQSLLGENLKANEYKSYKFIGGDKELIKQLLQLGYRHEGVSDIHKEILKHHLILVFQKK